MMTHSMAVQVNRTLTTLNIATNDLGPDSGFAIGKALKVICPRLVVPMPMLQTNNVLISVNCHDCKFGTDAVASITDALKASRVAHARAMGCAQRNQGLLPLLAFLQGGSAPRSKATAAPRIASAFFQHPLFQKQVLHKVFAYLLADYRLDTRESKSGTKRKNVAD